MNDVNSHSAVPACPAALRDKRRAYLAAFDGLRKQIMFDWLHDLGKPPQPRWDAHPRPRTPGSSPSRIRHGDKRGMNLICMYVHYITLQAKVPTVCSASTKKFL
jgi:hypothetical protein